LKVTTASYTRLSALKKFTFLWYITGQEIYTLEYNCLKPCNTGTQKSKKALVEVIKKYDPALWVSYNIIAPNEAIEGFVF